jgi:multiple sugar transport system permease protein
MSTHVGLEEQAWIASRRPASGLGRLLDHKPFLIVLCLTPAIGLLMVFLTYPLGLGIYLSFTDAQLGNPGHWVGLDNFAYLLTDTIFINTVLNTIFYTAAATVGKFALGLWLALILNQNLPFKSLLRAIILLPWITPTRSSASSPMCWSMCCTGEPPISTFSARPGMRGGR